MDQRTLGELRDHELSCGQETRSLVYAYLATNDVEPADIELVAEVNPQPVGGVITRYYVRPRGTARDIQALEAANEKASKLLRRALPQVMAHRRNCERALSEVNHATPEAKASVKWWTDKIAYLTETIQDIEDVLGIKTFSPGDDHGIGTH